jgi:hypothetical protein
MKTFNVQVSVEFLVDIEAADSNDALVKAVSTVRGVVSDTRGVEVNDVTVDNVTEVGDKYPFGQSGAV